MRDMYVYQLFASKEKTYVHLVFSLNCDIHIVDMFVVATKLFKRLTDISSCNQSTANKRVPNEMILSVLESFTSG